jgi:hypothetical protein
MITTSFELEKIPILRTSCLLFLPKLAYLSQPLTFSAILPVSATLPLVTNFLSYFFALQLYFCLFWQDLSYRV